MIDPVASTVPSFDQLQVQIDPGAGIVARFPGIVAVCGAVSPEKAGVLNRFLTICSEVSAGGARAPGRRLARSLGAWLAQLDDAPTLGTVAPTEGGLAIFLSGGATVYLGADGSRHSGRESAGWLDRIVEWPEALALAVDPDQGVVFTTSVFDLRQGVVPGRGVVMSMPSPSSTGRHASASVVLSEAAAPSPAEAEPEAIPEPVADADALAETPSVASPSPSAAPPAQSVAPPAPADQVVPPPPPAVAVAPDPAGPVAPAVGAPIQAGPRPPLSPPIRSARIFGAQKQEPPREPLPLPSVAGEPIPPVSEGTPQVQGFLCSRGHLNDPRGLFCGICGIRMAERTGILTIGRRPPLGLLVFDDGVTFTVDADYLLGREPDADARVRQGVVRPLVVVDTRGAVSRRHAEIRLDGWAVLLADIGSANGTFVAPRGQQSWSALVPQRPIPLEAGTRVRLGSRMFVFESPHGAP